MASIITFADLEGEIMGADVMLPVRITYSHYPFMAGARERGSGIQLEPDEPEHMVVECVEINLGILGSDHYVDITANLSADAITQIESALLNEL